MMLGSLTPGWFSLLLVFTGAKAQGTAQEHLVIPTTLAGSNPSSAVLHHSWRGKPGEERPEGKEKRFVCIPMAFPGATRPRSPRDHRDHRGSARARAPALGEASLLPAPFRPHSPLRKDSSRGIFSKNKNSLKTPVVNEQLVLSQTQCGHVETCCCPSTDPGPNGASLSCQTPPEQGSSCWGMRSIS